MDHLPKRNEVPVELTWNLKDIYPSQADWEEDVAASLTLAEEIASFEGRAARDAETLLHVLNLYESCLLKLYRLSSYANMLHDQDTANPENQALVQRARNTEVAIEEKLAFLEPEILDVPEETLATYMGEIPANTNPAAQPTPALSDASPAQQPTNTDPATQPAPTLSDESHARYPASTDPAAALSAAPNNSSPAQKSPQFPAAETPDTAPLMKYRVTLREIIRLRDHSLRKEQEKLLAMAGDMARTPSNGFGMLCNADLKFPFAVDSEGAQHPLSNGRFVSIQMSPDRGLRKDAFVKYYEKYKEFANTWAALYDGQIRQQIFFAKARKYPSTFEAAVEANNVRPEVCDNLIASVRRNLDKMHRYVKLRKQMLRVDELHMYDVYAPMVADYSVKVTYEEAREAVLKALKPLGEEYLGVVREAFAERWIDVAENEGKRSGAYSTGVYGVHPYMLLNWTGTLNDVFTLIHEMGHSMHTWYSSHEQSFLDSHYKIFVAEVASTTNEILLLEYLLGKAESEAERMHLLNHYLESFKGTLIRQTMFEEFERKTNAMAEQGIPLTADTLCETYLKLNREYFGEDMVSDPLIAYEWCRIPHFYYNFYVYQYATSFAASVAIAHRILEGGETEARRYLEFLKSGCTEDPVSLLARAGVDLSTGQPVDEALEVFGRVVESMEKMTD